MLTTNLGQPPNPFLFDCQLTTIEGCPTLASFARVGTTNLYRSFRCGVEADDSHPFANNAKGWGTRFIAGAREFKPGPPALFFEKRSGKGRYSNIGDNSLSKQAPLWRRVHCARLVPASIHIDPATIIQSYGKPQRKEIRQEKQIVALGRFARSRDVFPLLSKKSLYLDIVNFRQNVAGSNIWIRTIDDHPLLFNRASVKPDGLTIIVREPRILK